MKENIIIDNKEIGLGKEIYIAVEVGTTCNGDVATAKKLIEGAKNAGVDAIKFQIVGRGEVHSDHSVMFNYKTYSGEEKQENLVEMLKKYQFTLDEWKEIKEHANKHGITIFYTAPTAIRSFMKWGDEWPNKYDLSSLRLLGTVGETINPEAWMWYHQTIGKEKCPIVDTWWQTETGGILITPLPGCTPTKPGSATLPFFGIDAAVISEEGKEVEAGILTIRKPWPGMLRGIYGDMERYKQTYWSKWPNKYFPGDGARKDSDGYFWILGRIDDVVNVSGHRIGTAELESVFVEHSNVAEAAVIGIEHEIKGQCLIGFISLKEGTEATDELAQELKDWVGKKIGRFAIPEKIIFSSDLPKTRSGKIMRRLLRDIATGRALGSVTTLADAGVVEQLKVKYEEE